MKQLISILFLSAVIFYSACKNNSSDSKEKATIDSGTKASVPANDQTKITGSINEVVEGYLALKNALTRDQGNEAAVAAKQMGDALARVDESSLTADQKKAFGDVKNDIKEHSEHIGSNASDIAHQREHFDMLSQDMIELVSATGTSKPLYRDFCPMYNNKKGAYWLSETKEIRNPFYGKEMPICGEVKGEIKPKG